MNHNVSEGIEEIYTYTDNNTEQIEPEGEYKNLEWIIQALYEYKIYILLFVLGILSITTSSLKVDLYLVDEEIEPTTAGNVSILETGYAEKKNKLSSRPEKIELNIKHIFLFVVCFKTLYALIEKLTSNFLLYYSHALIFYTNDISAYIALFIPLMYLSLFFPNCYLANKRYGFDIYMYTVIRTVIMYIVMLSGLKIFINNISMGFNYGFYLRRIRKCILFNLFENLLGGDPEGISSSFIFSKGFKMKNLEKLGIESKRLLLKEFQKIAGNYGIANLPSILRKIKGCAVEKAEHIIKIMKGLSVETLSQVELLLITHYLSGLIGDSKTNEDIFEYEEENEEEKIKEMEMNENNYIIDDIERGYKFIRNDVHTTDDININRMTGLDIKDNDIDLNNRNGYEQVQIESQGRKRTLDKNPVFRAKKNVENKSGKYSRRNRMANAERDRVRIKYDSNDKPVGVIFYDGNENETVYNNVVMDKCGKPMVILFDGDGNPAINSISFDVITGNPIFVKTNLVNSRMMEIHRNYKYLLAQIDLKPDQKLNRINLSSILEKFYRDKYVITKNLEQLNSALSKVNIFLNLLVLVMTFAVLYISSSKTINPTLASISSALFGSQFISLLISDKVIDSIVLLFIIHPYDIGDRIFVNINGTQENLIVAELNIFSTTFYRWDGTSVFIPNHLLSKASITNIRRSGQIMETHSIQINSDTDMKALKKLKLHLIEFCKKSEHFTDYLLLNYENIEDSQKLHVKILIQYSGNWQNYDGYLVKRSIFIKELSRLLRVLNISFQLPVQRIEILNREAASLK